MENLCVCLLEGRSRWKSLSLSLSLCLPVALALREHDLILAKLFLGIYFGWNALPKKN